MKLEQFEAGIRKASALLSSATSQSDIERISIQTAKAFKSVGIGHSPEITREEIAKRFNVPPIFSAEIKVK